MKPWVQPSLYCVNLPSFSPDAIFFLPPPNTPIYAPICSAQLTSKMWLLMVANIAGNKCLCVLFWWRPPQSFLANLERATKSKGARGEDAASGGMRCGDHRQIWERDNPDGGGEKGVESSLFGVCRFLSKKIRMKGWHRLHLTESLENVSVSHSSDIKSQMGLRGNKSDCIYSQLMVEKTLLDDAPCNRLFPRRRQGPERISIRLRGVHSRWC